MPNYKLHCSFNVSTLVPLLVAMHPDRYNPPFIAGYLTATFFVSPDIDMNNSTPDQSLGWLWNKYWNPYNRLFKHRQASHFPVWGTLTRFVYLAWIPALVYVKYALGGDVDLFFKMWSWDMINFIGGMTTADNFHILLDKG